jgi:phosphoglycerate kinase
LVSGQDFYVNEAFQWCWLPLASIEGPPATLPSAAGLRLAADIALLEPFLHEPARPFVVVFGSDQSLSRLPGLRGLILRADAVLVGGAMALPFLQGIGSHPTEGAETELLRDCRACFGLAREIQHNVHLPSDLVWERPDGSVSLASSASAVEGLVSDIGPTTRLRFGEVLRGAGSVLWTGALGRAEDPRFAAGTLAVADSLPPGRHVVLGGDALLAILGDRLDSVTGVLSATESAVALLKDGDLPGLVALRRSNPGS